MEKGKVKPIPELAVEFSEEDEVFEELKKMRTTSIVKTKVPKKGGEEKKDHPPKENEKEKEKEKEGEFVDQFFVPVPRTHDDTRIYDLDLKYLQVYKKRIIRKERDEKRTMKIEDLPSLFEEKELFNYFKQFGGIVRVGVNRNLVTGEVANPRIGFVEFGSSEVLELVAEEFERTPILFDNEKIRVEVIENNDEYFLPFEKAKELISKWNNRKKNAKIELRRKIVNDWKSQNKPSTREQHQDFLKKRERILKENKEELLKSGIDYSYNPLKRQLDDSQTGVEEEENEMRKKRRKISE